LASLGHPSKFQWVSRLAFVIAATSLTGSQPNFARCLAISWAATLYIHFRGLCPLTEFCLVQSSLYVQVLRSRILAALLHGTPAADVSQTLRRSRPTRNGITELSQRVPPISGWAAITLGIGPHSSFRLICAFVHWFLLLLSSVCRNRKWPTVNIRSIIGRNYKYFSIYDAIPTNDTSHYFLFAQRYLARVLTVVVRLSVVPSVCHSSEFY